MKSEYFVRGFALDAGFSPNAFNGFFTPTFIGVLETENFISLCVLKKPSV